MRHLQDGQRDPAKSHGTSIVKFSLLVQSSPEKPVLIWMPDMCNSDGNIRSFCDRTLLKPNIWYDELEYNQKSR